VGVWRSGDELGAEEADGVVNEGGEQHALAGLAGVGDLAGGEEKAGSAPVVAGVGDGADECAQNDVTLVAVAAADASRKARDRWARKSLLRSGVGWVGPWTYCRRLATRRPRASRCSSEPVYSPGGSRVRMRCVGCERLVA
jgi:hypothetical protein